MKRVCTDCLILRQSILFSNPLQRAGNISDRSFPPLFFGLIGFEITETCGSTFTVRFDFSGGFCICVFGSSLLGLIFNCF